MNRSSWRPKIDLTIYLCNLTTSRWHLKKKETKSTVSSIDEISSDSYYGNPWDSVYSLISSQFPHLYRIQIKKYSNWQFNLANWAAVWGAVQRATNKGGEGYRGRKKRNKWNLPSSLEQKLVRRVMNGAAAVFHSNWKRASVQYPPEQLRTCICFIIYRN